MMENYFNIIPLEIFFKIIKFLNFESGWGLKSFALVNKNFYEIIKLNTLSISIVTQKEMFDTKFLYRNKEELIEIKSLFLDIQYIILFEQFKTFHLTIKKFEYENSNERKIRKYLILKNILYKSKIYHFFYNNAVNRNDYILDLQSNKFYSASLFLEKKIGKFWASCGDDDCIRGGNGKYFLFNQFFFNILMEEKLIENSNL
ncbi:hypothetical protein C2G38_2212378 [Gigaspora rosea]|uniref:F-box domain-containing protein n=1 Tax=Gigaspora rosea TaxID=44941 RepID=A0A397UH65_9GLOM|nr:hypothetical protein C2G38_2212378 [Gigaspora rosea]